MFSDATSRIVHGILLYVLQPLMIHIFHSCYPVDVLCIVEVLFSSIHQYILFCTSNLTGILMVDYLVVVLVYSFEKDFAVDFSPT